MKIVVDMGFIHRYVLMQTPGLGHALVQCVFDTDGPNYERRRQLVEGCHTDTMFHCRVAEHQARYSRPVPLFDDPPTHKLQEAVAHKMIGFKLPVIRVHNDYLEYYLQAATIDELEEEYYPFKVGNRNHRITMNELPLARILTTVATNKNLSPQNQYALVALVASSQMIHSNAVNQIFSCTKTLLFVDHSVADYRIWINVYLKHFLRKYGPTAEIGMVRQKRFLNLIFFCI